MVLFRAFLELTRKSQLVHLNEEEEAVVSRILNLSEQDYQFIWDVCSLFAEEEEGSKDKKAFYYLLCKSGVYVCKQMESDQTLSCTFRQFEKLTIHFKELCPKECKQIEEDVIQRGYNKAALVSCGQQAMNFNGM